MPRVEFSEKIKDITDEELQREERYGIEPKEVSFKWRRIWFNADDIFSVNELTGKETELEFYDGSVSVVKGSYDKIKQTIEAAELEET